MTFKILVLNRNEEFHDMIQQWDKEIFSDKNYLFYYVDSEQAALAFLDNHPDVDLILGDVNPDNAYYSEFLQKCQLCNPLHRYILVSDNEKNGDIKGALKQGVFEHLARPINKESLASLISRSHDHMSNQKEQQQPEAIRYSKLKKTIKQTIQAIAHICELKDPYTAGHQKRVAEISKSIAEHLNLDEFQIDEIYYAGFLHDIGKIVIPLEILTRPGGLSIYEMELVRQHSAAGFDILKDIDFPWNIKDLVEMHHERLDGSGYPHRLSRNEIPLGARIISVADVLEAVTSFRPYRPALGIARGLEVLKSEAKDQKLDPIIVSACIDLVEKGEITL